ncbi:DDE-type integrase/transposase/recombinase [Pseudomonas sp. SAS7]|uniref:Mu transposase C-terminal domain-containing protein n=1 Tax=Pseudomonas sp. SAS7 TaxID=3156487 RepID=UPI003F9BC562
MSIENKETSELKGLLDVRSGEKTLAAHFEAQNRFNVVMDFKSGKINRAQAMEILGLSRSHFHRLVTKCRGATGYTALLQQKKGRKFGSLRGRSDVRDLIREMFNKHFPTTRTISGVWTACQSEADARRIPRPSYYLVKRFYEAQDPALVYKHKHGLDAAKQKFELRDGYKQTNRPLEWVQIDHTPVDLLVVDDQDRSQIIGRPYISMAICLHSRVVLGFYLSFLAPSAVSVAMLMENIVLPKNEKLKSWGLPDDLWPMYGKPEVIHSDNAKEFVSDVFVLNASSYGIAVKHRTKGRKHEGAHIESLIGKQMLHTIHQIPGSTGSNTQQRKMMNSEGKACFTLAALRQALVYRIKAYHETIHSALNKKTPGQVWEEYFTRNPHSRDLSSEEYENFKYTFYPEAPKKKKVSPEGIEIFRRFYSCPLLKSKVSQELDVKYDPYDLSYILVRIGNKWDRVPCSRNKLNKSIDFELYRKQRQERGVRDGTMTVEGAKAQGVFHQKVEEQVKSTRAAKRAKKREKGKEDYKSERNKALSEKPCPAKSSTSSQTGWPQKSQQPSKKIDSNVYSLTGYMSSSTDVDSDEAESPVIYGSSPMK